MKLIIQIPAFNEEKTLEQTIKELPKEIEGIDKIEYLVIDDGSSDATVEVAKNSGVEHVISLGTNRGLARAFSSGLEYSLSAGADIVVNTDGDNQYCGQDISKLVKPIVNNQADVVVGCRPIIDHPEFHPLKKMLQILGSWTLRQISKTKVRDATSGFRAFSRTACQRLFIHSRFSHCMETLIQAGNSGLRVASVDIRINPTTRSSRLFKSTPQYLFRQGITMINMFLLYRPGAFFFALALPFLVLALFLGIRFLYLIYWVPKVAEGRTYLASLILLAISAFLGFIMIALAIMGELIKSNRRITEETLYLKRIEQFGSCS